VAVMTCRPAGLPSIIGNLALLALLAGCWQVDRGALPGRSTPVPTDFSFAEGTWPCILEVESAAPRTLRVNCFQIDGDLHIHSNRFARFPRFRGESWVDTVRRDPLVRVSIDDNIYSMLAMPIANDEQRVQILHDRGYLYAWPAITVFRFDRRRETPAFSP
jgi:hypothetical protein